MLTPRFRDLQRQKEMVKNLYNECMALEELLEEAVNALGPDARDILAQIRQASLKCVNCMPKQWFSICDWKEGSRNGFLCAIGRRREVGI